jgi:hypothetical protein
MQDSPIDLATLFFWAVWTIRQSKKLHLWNFPVQQDVWKTGVLSVVNPCKTFLAENTVVSIFRHCAFICNRFSWLGSMVITAVRNECNKATMIILFFVKTKDFNECRTNRESCFNQWIRDLRHNTNLLLLVLYVSCCCFHVSPAWLACFPHFISRTLWIYFHTSCSRKFCSLTQNVCNNIVNFILPL